MRLISFLKPGLFFYECFRILVLILILILKSGEQGLAIRMIFSAPSALFALMALFIWLDIDKYRTYLPLFMAGKIIGVFLEALWSIINGQVTMIIRDSTDVLARLILSGDLFALAAVLMIIRSLQKPDMEEN